MPTILRFGAFRVMIYTEDHHPAHVHVLGRGGEIIFHLDCSVGHVSVRERRDISRKEEQSIAEFLEGNLAILCKAWKGLHDDR